jgi:O-antigen/teichoic acid export membrane protein
MESSVKNRILRGLGAQGLGQVVNILSQILVPPAMFLAWGIQKVGEWQIVSCLPAYLTLSEIGLSGAAGNKMAMAAERGDYQKANEVFQSAILMIGFMAIFVSVPVAFLTCCFRWTSTLNLVNLDDKLFRLVIISQVIAVFTQQFINLVNSAFRCNGNFVFGSMMNSSLRFVEVCVQVLFVFATSLLGLSIVMLLVKLSQLLVLLYCLRRRLGWLKLGMSQASYRTAREMIAPGLSFMGFPIGNAISAQGTILLIGMLAGPSMVAVYSAHRTIVNTLTQVMAMINYSIWPELTSAFARNDYATCRAIHRQSCCFSFWIALIAGPLLFLLSPIVIHYWTLGNVAYDQPLMIAFFVYIMFRSFWYTSSVVSAATNRQQIVALGFIGLSIASLLVTYFGMLTLGLATATAFVGICEMGFSFLVLRQSLLITQDSLWLYLKSVLSPRWHLSALLTR